MCLHCGIVCDVCKGVVCSKCSKKCLGKSI
jgi:hypothetical protein